MEPTYQPQKSESKIYKLWEKGGLFTPAINYSKKPFVIIMPPPNANGILHIGHAVFVTIEDIMIRYQRMKGRPTLWLPGTDHAGIITQVVYEKELKKQKKSRFDLGRKEFYKQTYQFTMRNKKVIESQLKKLGASCDWSREKFTLDPKITQAVYYTFKKMYNEGLIYRGERIINWCPRCQTALSDLEVKYENRSTELTFIKYPIIDSNEFLTVATTRPETMLGDTAVAVNPADKRYQHLLKKNIEIQLPLTQRVIPLIADQEVEIEFGTGVVKITPGHDPKDFEIGERHQLPIIKVIGQDGKMTREAGPDYAGLDLNSCRQKVIADLKKQGLLVKQENYQHSVATCERCQTIIEPLVSQQWFIKMKKLADLAIKAVKEKKIKFIPDYFTKIYYNWLENIRDWCISRQIWWGQQLPVWYCQRSRVSNSQFLISKQFQNSKFNPHTKKLVEGQNSTAERFIVSDKPPKKCPFCQKCQMEQSTDVLDTWFSSAQWPFTVFGWPKKTKDFKYFYPTTVMETGYDILFFWVARMIMLGIYCTGKVPFKYVFLHGLVRDKDRQKMSKSKGNVIDPLRVIDLYGADVLRMALIFGTAAGSDVIISEEKIIGQRRFANKIWNAARFILLNLGNDIKFLKMKKKDLQLTKEDRWILSELKSTIRKIDQAFQKFNFHQAAKEIYHFFWHKFCDKTIEDVKKRLQQSKKLKDKLTGKWVLYQVLLNSLKLLHPFMPFLTEEIYQRLPVKPKKALIIENWPSE